MSEGGDGFDEELILEPMDIERTQDEILSSFTTLLMEESQQVPFVALYAKDESEVSDPRRLCKLYKKGPASPFLFTLARELCTEPSLDLQRSVLITYMFQKSPLFKAGRSCLDNDDSFKDKLNAFIRQSKHPLFFIVYQEPNGRLKSHLKADTHVHKYSFWHTFISNIKKDDSTLDFDAFAKQLLDEEPPKTPAELEDVEVMDFGDDDDVVVDNHKERAIDLLFDSMTCKDVMETFKEELGKLKNE